MFRRFDYSSIYLLIGGTFAPFYLVYLGNVLGIVLFCVQWALIVFGITMVCVFGPGRWRPLHYTLYFAIGWSGLMFLPMWYQNDVPLLWLILTGGAVYTLGMVPFTMRVKCSHFIWHWFVILGAVLHWFGIYLYVYYEKAGRTIKAARYVLLNQNEDEKCCMIKISENRSLSIWS